MGSIKEGKHGEVVVFFCFVFSLHVYRIFVRGLPLLDTVKVEP